MNVRFLEGGPALLVQNRCRTLVVADLHIGIEADLAAHGWHIPSRSAGRLERLLACIRDSGPDQVVLLGDVKHNLPVTTRQEYRELPILLDAIRNEVPFVVVPGNHDTGIARFLHEGELLPMSGAMIDGTGYIHGHTIPAPELAEKLIIAGHHHPLVAIRDEVGCSLRAPAYLRAVLNPSLFRAKKSGEQQETVDASCMEPDKETMPACGDEIPRNLVTRIRRKTGKKPGEGGRTAATSGTCTDDIGVKPGDTRVLLVPAFNECAGFDVMRILRHPFSPISRALRQETAEIFLTDGTCLGYARQLAGEDDREPA